MSIRLDDRQRFDWLRLSRSEGVGPRTFQGLINRFGGAAAALEALPSLAKVRGRAIRIPGIADIEAELRLAERMRARFIAYGESDYPDLLRQIDGPPPLIAVLGRVDTFDMPCIGIVGARNSSAPGRKFAGMLASGLAEAGFCVVSGLARGIDTEAHRASLARGTIAVLAGGLDKPYPPENIPLMDEITEKGAVITEMPFGLSPRGRDFPRRNRVISGLSMGVIVVEAARRSGSLITARYANEQGREVFAVPGSPLDPRCEGTNDLLREGATLITSAQDAIAVLTPLAGDMARAPRLFREPVAADAEPIFEEWLEEGDDTAPVALPFQHDAPDDDGAESLAPDLRLLSMLSYSPIEVDSLIRMLKLEPRVIQTLLMDLELSGDIIRHGGNRVAKAIKT